MKYREDRAGVAFAPSLKQVGDLRALDFKAFLARCRAESATWPPRATLLLRASVHQGALSFASFARTLERGAHQVADRVSHKHGFERTQTKSTFLRQVSEYKNGAQGAVDVR